MQHSSPRVLFRQTPRGSSPGAAYPPPGSLPGHPTGEDTLMAAGMYPQKKQPANMVAATITSTETDTAEKAAPTYDYSKDNCPYCSKYIGWWRHRKGL